MKTSHIIALLIVVIAIGACVPSQKTTTQTDENAVTVEASVNQQQNDLDQEITDLETTDSGLNDTELDDLGLDIFE